MALLTDAVATLEITATKYERLVRESEQLATVKKLLEKKEYVSSDDLKTILDIKEKEKKEDGNKNE